MVVWGSRDGDRKGKDSSLHAFQGGHISVAVCTCPPCTYDSSCTVVAAFAGDTRVAAVCKPPASRRPPYYGNHGYRT